MQSRYCGSRLLFSALLLLVFVNITIADSRQTRTPARILAKQTGATQFEEERFETHTDCNEHKHHVKKRSSDEDVDYEVYQGVVGRPGIDFPIYPRIPKTTFSCRSFGNGYFADMDTDCQVFHICEEGRKISFLCPNGTIFQQSELTCDWWFKVNCLGSPGYYAESAELLNKQRVQRVRPSVPVQGFNIVGGGLNIKPKVASSSAPRSRHNNKPERRIDSNEEPSLESVDFDDISGEKQLRGQPNKQISNIDNNNNDESQITAESASFIGSKRRNSYAYEKPNSDAERKPSEGRNNGRNGSGGPSSRRGNGDRGSQRNGYANLQPNNFNNESTERARGGQRGQSRFKEEKKPLAESLERSNSNESSDTKHVLPEKLVKPIVPVEISQKSNFGASSINADIEDKPEFYQAQSTIRSAEKTQKSTPLYPAGTYSTARRLDSTRTTPFYTPTVPTVSKSKTTEGKAFYIKGKVNSGLSATTPNPNRFNGNGGAGSSLILESSAAPSSSGERSDSSTFRPFIIGMRHHYDVSSPETHRLSVTPKNHFSAELPVQKANKIKQSLEYLPTSTPASTGPTYLPKSAKSPKAPADAAGDLLLFAPSPIADGASVSRHVDDMLKTINLIKDKLDDDVEELKFPGQTRAGLEIPPSSGPDALVSLAKYFAAEQNGSNSLNRLSEDKPSKTKTSSSSSNPLPTFKLSAPPALKPSDTTASLTTAATPNISGKADDIKTSLLSEKTVNKYTNLFGLKDPKTKAQSGDLSEGLLSHVTDTNEGSNNKNPTNNPFPQIGSTDATIRQLAAKPESRKIAKVFSNALTTYLEDPETFREQLVSVRPTEPPIGGKANFETVTATDATLFNSGTAASYLPTRPTPAGDYRTTTQANIAAEINNNFDYSTQFSDLTSTTEYYESTTYRPAHTSNEQKLKLELSAELLPPSSDSGEGEELLQREHTQSFVNSRNNLGTGKESPKNAQKTGAYSAKPTENPWNHISQTDFLDPLTINDGLMKGPRTTTASPFTYLPKETTTQISHGKLQVLNSDSQRGSSRFGVTTPRTTYNSAPYRSQEALNSWHDIFNTYDLPLETLPSSSGLQRIANKLFGGLNENEALHLKNVMQQAEHNRQVLSLLLLLIQTCDDQNGKALERSRKHLLNALIDMDGKLQKEGNGKTTQFKTTTTRVPPVTTYRRGSGSDDSFTSTTPYTPTTTDLPTTTLFSSTLYPGSSSSSVEETTKFEIRVEDTEETFATASSGNPTHNSKSNSSSDKRALELLKSLYSLASKFTARR